MYLCNNKYNRKANGYRFIFDEIVKVAEEFYSITIFLKIFIKHQLIENN